MVAKTFHEVLRAFQQRQPFKPFVVELVNGQEILVRHPEALAFQGGAGVYIRPQTEFVLFDHEGVADVRDQTRQARRQRPPEA